MHKLYCEFSKLKVVLFLQTRGESAEVLWMVNEDLSFPYERRIEGLRTDRGGKCIDIDSEHYATRSNSA